ncbi:hypothetical protein BDR06DRAFT_969939 [Suillus hirtellus]|nr:hypothetical protein BDR06DRAFT_969939 [Suillus hirtellus]
MLKISFQTTFHYILAITYYIQDLFYGSMDQQPPWMGQDLPDGFSMMQPDSFMAGLLRDQALGMVGVGNKSLWCTPSVTNTQGSYILNVQNMAHLAPPSSHMPFHFPASSSTEPVMSHGYSLDPVAGQASGFMHNSPYTLCPVLLQDHANPIPAMKIIPLMPLKDGDHNTNAATVNTTNAPPASTRDYSPMLELGCYSPTATNHVWFPEDNELVMQQEDHMITSCRTCCEWHQLLESELGCIGKDILEGGGMPSVTLQRQCYEKFKNTFADAYQDILLKHEEVALLGLSPQTIAQHGQAFQKHYQSVINILKSGSAMFGFEAAIMLCGKVVNEDGSLSHFYHTPDATGFWETQCHASDDVIISHLKAHMYNTTSLSVVHEAFPGTKDKSHDNLMPSLTNDTASFGGKINSTKIFPWKLMPAVLVEANLSIQGYPMYKCLLPGEAHSKLALNKDIGALMQKEIVVLVDSLKSGTMHLTQFSNKDQAALIASQKPIIEGEAPPPEWPHHVVPKLPATQSEVIELTSTEDNPIEDPDTEYEDVAHGKKRKLKAGNTLHVLKKVGLSTEKADALKVGKKGGPLSPLTVGSLSDGLPSPEHNGPSDQPKQDCVKPRPVTKNSQVMMKHRLHMAYRDSDSEADVNESMKADSTTTTNVIPKATGSANIVSEEKSTQLTKDEGVRDMEELPPTSPLNAVIPTIPNQQALHDLNTPHPCTPSLSMSLKMVVTLHTTHSMTIHAILSTTLKMVTTIHATLLLMKTLEVPFATLHTTLKRLYMTLVMAFMIFGILLNMILTILPVAMHVRLCTHMIIITSVLTPKSLPHLRPTFMVTTVLVHTGLTAMILMSASNH